MTSPLPYLYLFMRMTCNGAAIEHSTLPSSVYVCDAGRHAVPQRLRAIYPIRPHSACTPPAARPCLELRVIPYSARVRKSSNPRGNPYLCGQPRPSSYGYGTVPDEVNPFYLYRGHTGTLPVLLPCNLHLTIEVEMKQINLRYRTSTRTVPEVRGEQWLS